MTPDEINDLESMVSIRDILNDHNITFDERSKKFECPWCSSSNCSLNDIGEKNPVENVKCWSCEAVAHPIQLVKKLSNWEDNKDFPKVLDYLKKLTGYREAKKEVVITMREVLAALQLMPPNKLGQIVCPFHPEKRPVCLVFEDHARCPICKQSANKLEFITAVKDCTEEEAQRFIEKVALSPRVEYNRRMNSLAAIDEIQVVESLKHFWANTDCSVSKSSGAEYWHNRKLTDEVADIFGVKFVSKTTYLDGGGKIFAGINIPMKKNGVIYSCISVDHTGKRDQNKLPVTGTHFTHPFNIDNVNTKLTTILHEKQIDCMSSWQLGFKNVISVYGVESWKSMSFTDFDDLILLFDNDEAGSRATIQFLTKYPRTKVLRLPDGIKDVNEWLQKGVTSEEFLKFVETAKVPEPVVVSTVSAPVAKFTRGDFYYDSGIFRDDDEKPLSPNMWTVSNALIEWGKKIGHWVFEATPLKLFTILYIKDEAILFERGEENNKMRYFLNTQTRGYLTNEAKLKEFLCALNDIASRDNEISRVHSHLWSQRKDNTLYLYARDSMFRISSRKIELIKQNEDNVAILKPIKYNNWPFDASQNKEEAMNLYKTLYVDNVAVDDPSKIWSAAINLASMFSMTESLHPIRENVGAPQAGKTEEGKLHSDLFYGLPESRVPWIVQFMSGQEDNLLRTVEVAPYVCVDNLEERDARKIVSILQGAATGATSVIRKMYSESLKEFQLHGLLCRTCIVGAGGEASKQRVISFRFDSKYKRNDYDISKSYELLDAARPKILSGLFRIFAEEVLVLREKKEIAINFFKSIRTYRERMNEFLYEALYWVAVLSRYWKFDWEKVSKDFWEENTREYSRSLADAEPFIELLLGLKNLPTSSVKSEFLKDEFVLSGTIYDFKKAFTELDRFRVTEEWRNVGELRARFDNASTEALNVNGITMDCYHGRYTFRIQK